MKKAFFILILGVIIVSAAGAVASAATTSSFDVTATITNSTSLSVSISKVVGTTWTANQSAVDFGTLKLDTNNSIFVPSDNCYYAVDVGVTSNAASWTLSHAKTNVALTTNSSSTLNDKILVTFMAQSNSTNSTLSTANYGNSAYSVSSSTLGSGNWLRIYYGIATNSSTTTGVTPIPATQAPGTYKGTVTITVS